jgi:hypothetical protein
VRFLSRDGSRIVAFDDPEATPITITEFSEKPEFVRGLLKDWYNQDQGSVRSADLLVQYCSSCGRRVVIDGVHRIVRIAVEWPEDVNLHVTELAGSRWPQNMPDMGVVCSCVRAVR